MASSSSRTWRYRVFTSFHGPDVRKTFVSHLRKQFYSNAITMFDDQGIERSQIIAPALTQAIRESRISIVVLSKTYASSSWCLDELLEILKCKEEIGQIVMTVFYGVDPSDVRKQTGDFGIAFHETCAHKTEEERQNWSQALNYVGNIAGEHFLNWDNEATMIEKIAKDVLDKLNVTPSRDFDGMVGLEAHLTEMQFLLDLDYDGVMMVAIYGPAGIGKTTIARALYSLFSNRFQLTCFVDNLRGSYHSGFDEYGLKLRLQEEFLSKILNQNGMRICHLGAIKENLCDQKVLIILDDVNNLKQLEALANEMYGPGSRIVVTTENKELLQQHGINNMYHVGFPSYEEAIQILCSYAFRKTSPHHGFRVLAERITKHCGKLPLGLRVVGSSLRGEKEEKWEDVMNKLETTLDRDIDDVLRVGYENLDEKEQTLFLHIAVFFDNKHCDLVKAMFDDDNLDVKCGLKILVNRSLVNICYFTGNIMMHKLLRQMARQAIHKQEPWKRQILMDAHEICDVLENETGTRTLFGISFDISGINELLVSKKAFKRMPNLRFLKVYKSKCDGNDTMHVPEEMEFPRRLRLLHWKEYPSKCLSPRFHPEYLVELNMQKSELEYLWEGTQPLKNLKKMNLEGSSNLKELPNLSNATNLERLSLAFCTSLVEIPSSFSHLHKLEKLWMSYCRNLEVIPAHMNLASLEHVYMDGCSRLKRLPVMSTNITLLYISKTSIRHCSRLLYFTITDSARLKGITHFPTNVKQLDLSNSDIERIPDCIKALHRLHRLYLSGCTQLSSLPELPCSLTLLRADNCESLETVFCPFNTTYAEFSFTNCFKLDQQARKAIIPQSFFHGWVLLPGREAPAEFDHRAKGNTITIPHSTFSRFKVCLVISPNHESKKERNLQVLCRRIVKGDLDPLNKVYVGDISKCQKEHLFLFHSALLLIDPSEVSREIVFEFSSEFHDFDIIECGVQTLTNKTIQWSLFEDGLPSLTNGSYEFEPSQVFEIDDEDDCSDEFEPSKVSQDSPNSEHTDVLNCDSKGDDSVEPSIHIDCWSWLFLRFDLSYIVRNMESLASGRRQ